MISELPVQCLLAAGFCIYLAKSPEDVRLRVMGEWCDAVDIRQFNFLRRMSSESDMLVFKSEGLPADELSMQNANVLLNAHHAAPLIIDPATAALNWLKTHLSAKKCTLEVLPHNDPRFQTQVELAVRFGKTLIISEVDGVEPLLYPLLRKDLSRQGPRMVVPVGEKLVDYNENFRVFLATRNPFPDLPPDASAIVTEVNFSVTRSGLEGQLLGVTIKHEQPELEKQKSSLLKREEDFKVQLASLEKELLETLASAEGDILQNQKLLDTLAKTKAASKEIADALEESAMKSEELDRQREQYRPFAEHGSALYFLLQLLRNVEHMYQFSLPSFVTLFSKTLDESMDFDDVASRIAQLKPMLEKSVLFDTSRALFKEHRLMFALHLVHKIHPSAIDETEWDFFVGTLAPDPGAKAPRDFPKWAPRDRIPIYRLFKESFPDVFRYLNIEDADTWSAWSHSPTCEEEFPSRVQKKVSPFQEVLVTQILRPDRLHTAMLRFVCRELGINSPSPSPLVLRSLYEGESTAGVPILMITTTGADPSKDVEDFAVGCVGRDRYHELAMGGGQQSIALGMVRDGMQNGDWVCLKNLHLVTAWLPILEKELSSKEPHQDFRLWLTTESHPAFPRILLQTSIKVTFESPPGVKKNLQRTFEDWSPEFLKTGSVVRSQLLFVLAWFHALSQERRNYIPQGWTKFYEFSFADLRAGVNVIEASVKGATGSPPWQTIHGLMMNAIYGGRVDNPFDVRMLQTYLEHFFCNDMIQGRRMLIQDVSLPNSDEFKDYMQIINSLPDADAPELFHLPANIDRTVQRALSAATIASLQQLSVVGNASGSSIEQWRVSLSPMLELWKKLKADDDVLEKGGSKKLRGDAAPLASFLSMEMDRAEGIVELVDASLGAIQSVLDGTELLTPEVQSEITALLANEVPKSWVARWAHGPEKARAWVRALVSRKVALVGWVKDATQGKLLESPRYLSELLHPGVFLNALRQETARASNCAIDELRLVSAWKHSLLESEPTSMRLGGLLLQGAEFDGSRLSLPESDAHELIEAPVCTIAWVDKTKGRDPYSSSMLSPLYRSTLRESLLVEIMLPLDSKEEAAQWTMCGLALFLAAD